MLYDMQQYLLTNRGITILILNQKKDGYGQPIIDFHHPFLRVSASKEHTPSIPVACSCTSRQLNEDNQLADTGVVVYFPVLICLGGGLTLDRFEKPNFVTKCLQGELLLLSRCLQSVKVLVKMCNKAGIKNDVACGFYVVEELDKAKNNTSQKTFPKKQIDI